MNQKRKFTLPNYNKKWHMENEDSDPEEDSVEFEEDEAELEDLKNLLRELLSECRKLNTSLKTSSITET